VAAANITLSSNGAGGAANDGSLSLSHATVTANTGGGIVGAGITTPGSVDLVASIVGDQASGADCAIAVTSNGDNADSDGSCAFTGAGDATGPAKLTPLQLFHVPYHLPAAGSIAIDAIPPGTFCNPSGHDQRGGPRLVGGGCDRGAVEADFSHTPVAADDTFGALEDDGNVTLDVMFNDNDLDPGDTRVINTINTVSTLGSVTNNGTNITYNPNGAFNELRSGQTRDDHFSYTIVDSVGNTDFAFVTVTITGANDAPTAVADTATTDKSTPITIDVVANDTDPDQFDTRFLDSVDSTGTTGHAASTGPQVFYDPAGQFDALAPGESATDTFSYTIEDIAGATSTATVTVTITG
jgi:VCBS repeat-containing protein